MVFIFEIRLPRFLSLKTKQTKKKKPQFIFLGMGVVLLAIQAL